MEAPKENKIVNKHDVLQPIASIYYDESNYSDIKLMYYYFFNCYVNDGCSITQSVLTEFNEIDNIMDDNGMDKFIAMIAGMLFMIENDEVHTDVAYGVNWDIKDFETGNYDDLFTSEDLTLIKNDIKLIKDYIKRHTELLLDENEDKIFKEGKFI